MKRLMVFLWLCAVPAGLQSQNFSGYILAANRTNTAEIISASTLETVARIHFDFPIERISGVDAFQLAVAGYTGNRVCCSEYALDLATLRLAARAPSTGSSNFGPPLISPDGRWEARLKSFRGPALRMIDRMTGVAHDLIPPGLSLSEEACGGNWAAQGAWSAASFYLYVACPNHPGFLWSVPPRAAELGIEVQLDNFNRMPGCPRPLPVAKSLVAAGTGLFLYEIAGDKGSRSCPVDPPGGLWRVDPSTGRLHDPLVQDLHLGQLRTNDSGSVLYGVVHAHPDSPGAVQLVAIDAREGRILRSRNLDGGAWNISFSMLATVGGDLKAKSAQ